MRVRSGASSWKVTAPSTYPLAPSDFHTIRSSGTWSMMVDFQSRWERKICARHDSSVSDSCSTFSTFFMKSGNSVKRVHWSYATRRGTPTSIDSTMFVTLVLPAWPPPPPPPPPVTASLIFPGTALPAWATFPMAPLVTLPATPLRIPPFPPPLSASSTAALPVSPAVPASFRATPPSRPVACSSTRCPAALASSCSSWVSCSVGSWSMRRPPLSDATGLTSRPCSVRCAGRCGPPVPAWPQRLHSRAPATGSGCPLRPPRLGSLLPAGARAARRALPALALLAGFRFLGSALLALASLAGFGFLAFAFFTSLGFLGLGFFAGFGFLAFAFFTSLGFAALGFLLGALLRLAPQL